MAKLDLHRVRSMLQTISLATLRDERDEANHRVCWTTDAGPRDTMVRNR